MKKNISHTITIKNKNYKVIFRFPILWNAWECDSEGFVAIDDKQKKHIILTNHGHPYLGNVKELEDKIVEYQETIQLTKKAIKFVQN